MKARVKATGEIVEVEPAGMTGYYYLKNHDYKKWAGCDLDFNYYKPDYWTKLEHQYAGMAMQGILSNEDMQKELMRVFGKEEAIEDTIVDYAKDMAQLLVKKMKEERK